MATENQNLKDKLGPGVKEEFELRPVSSIFFTTSCFGVLGCIFIVLGILILHASSLVKEISLRYDDHPACKIVTLKSNSTNSSSLFNETKNNLTELNSTNVTEYSITYKEVCDVDFVVPETMDAPVFFYYELVNFYQNHRRFIKSLSLSQLTGKVLNTSELDFDCAPIVTVKDLGINTTFGKNVTLSPEDPANPCGLYPRSFFNDSYILINSTHEIHINETGIAWPSDYQKYKSPPNAENIQWIDVKNEHFMVWMRPSGFSNFRKLWGKIESDIHPGNYTLRIKNNYNVSSFDGSKLFVLATATIMGGKCDFLGTTFIVIGVVCVLVSVIFVLAQANKGSFDDKKKKL